MLINNDLEIHKQVKTNEIKFQRLGNFMTPSRNDLMNTVRVKKSSFKLALYSSNHSLKMASPSRQNVGT